MSPRPPTDLPLPARLRRDRRRLPDRGHRALPRPSPWWSTCGPSGAAPASSSARCSNGPSRPAVARSCSPRSTSSEPRCRAGVPGPEHPGRVRRSATGSVVAQFVGAQPQAEIERFLDELVPTEADRAVQRARALTGEETRGRAAAGARARSRATARRRSAWRRLLVDHDPDGRARAGHAPTGPTPPPRPIATRAELAVGDAGEVDLDELRAAVDGRRRRCAAAGARPGPGGPGRLRRGDRAAARGGRARR